MTDNLRDFPEEKIPAGIQIVSPEEFAYETVAMRPDLGLAAVQAMAARSGRNHPSLGAPEILATLDKLYGLNDATHIIRGHLETGEPGR